MQEVNWNNFRAKFNGKEQKSFEWLCYLLFCDEFNQHYGIQRYYNQAGIETEPIKINGRWIGFQAKFYETKISENKKDIIDSIVKAKNKNPQLNKILFYINKEFRESTKKGEKDPKYKIDIEENAKSNSVEIVWKVPSHFERQLTLYKNHTLAQHFFSLGKSAIDFIDELKQHTARILTPIHSSIIFNGTEIKIDRTKTLIDLKDILNKSSMVILSGEGGVGKTAVIKDFYDECRKTGSFFVFKAVEFNILNINDLFNKYGNYTLSDFIKEHDSITEKYVLIDSAEKLSDIESQEIFQEFLSALATSSWKIIFTTRYSYLNDLEFQFIQVYHQNFNLLNIEKLTNTELVEFSKKYNFSLPSSERLSRLIQNPFYLNEYLQIYNRINASTNYSEFKNILWNKQILKSSYRKDNTHLKRERCFLEIAKSRAVSGKFFVNVYNYSERILQHLENDEIIKYESNAGGYFITQDIYEEWALDKIIERNFCNSENPKNFYDEIGSSLPIRRAFRNWLSEKLINNKSEVKTLIEESIAIASDNIKNFWIDEILVSVLLSDYSELFIQLFENKLLENKQKLLMRIVFLLRIACKEVDESFLNLIELQKTDAISLASVFTKPKGNGWNNVINCIHNHKEEFGLQNMHKIIPLLYDWTQKNKKGNVTKKASQIALYYYKEIAQDEGFGYRNRNERIDQLISVILLGASEIKDELKIIFDEILNTKNVDSRSKYYEIVETILTSLTYNFEVVKCLPEYVIKLADLFWYKIPKEKYQHSLSAVEESFCLSHNDRFQYYPSSAIQTPVYQLLKFSPFITLDFVLSFTNRAVECYLESELKNEIEEVEVHINENETVKQYISPRLWNMYRGTQVATYLLESIHMALEKWLLEYAKTANEELLEKICFYLIKKSTSSSITAVVTSVVLSHPSQLFNIAKILFQTKEFFLYETRRGLHDRTHKAGLEALRDNLSTRFEQKYYEDERITACDEKHRKLTLEDIALWYQVFVSEKENEEVAKERQKNIWKIFDKYYDSFPDEKDETDSDKTWKLYLARMDRRKMNPEVEETDGNLLIKFKPELPPKLKDFSDDSLKQSDEFMKYTSLHLWAMSKFEGDENAVKNYPLFDNDPQLVIAKTKEIVEGLKKINQAGFNFFNYTIPAYTCTVLIRDYFNSLTQKDREFCKDIIIKYAFTPLNDMEYNYQVSDGTEPTVSILSNLLNHFPNNKGDIKSLILLLLFNPWEQLSSFAIRSVLHNLWEINFKDAHSIFLGYLFLKPRYEELRLLVRDENYKNKIFHFSENQVVERFMTEYKDEINIICENEITYEQLDRIDKLELYVLNTAFELLPINTKNEEHLIFLNTIFPIFSKKIFNDRNDKVDYRLKLRFLNKFAYLVLNSTTTNIKEFLHPFVYEFDTSRDTAELIKEFISVEDRLCKYEEFWTVWDIFYKKIIELCNNNNSYHYTKETIHYYLLAWPYWKEDAKEWHTLKEKDKLFFKKVAQEIGHNPSVLYSISKILNDIGSSFINEGVFWISDILKNNKNYATAELEINTIYYIENLMRKYIFMNRQIVKTNSRIKDDVIVILNFLVERGSVTGYLLREDIL